MALALAHHTTENDDSPSETNVPFPGLCAASLFLPFVENDLDTLFIRSWDIYLAAKANQACQLTLREFVDTSLKETPIAPVAISPQILLNLLPSLPTR